MHIRQQLRNAVATALAGLATTGPRVYASRVHVMGEPHLPGLRIATNSEEVELQTAHAPNLSQFGQYRRTVELVVDACVKRSDQAAELLDTICEEVETVLASGVTVDSQQITPILTGVEIEMDGGVDQKVEVASMRYTCVLFTRANQPGRHSNAI